MAQTFGERLSTMRMKRGLTQIELSRLAKVPPSTLNYLERGIRSGEKVALGIARRLAETLGVTLDYLAGMHEEKERHDVS